MSIRCTDTGEEVETYSEYLQTEHWKLFKEDYKEYNFPRRCFICDTNSDILDFHHLNYDSLGCEEYKDVVTLCRPCHTSHHDIVKSMKQRGEEVEYNIVYYEDDEPSKVPPEDNKPFSNIPDKDRLTVGFTRGKWSISEDSPEGTLDIIDSNNNTVCSVRVDPYNDFYQKMGDKVTPSTEQAANANLIRMAPFLFRGLEELVYLLDRCTISKESVKRELERSKALLALAQNIKE